MNAPPERHAAAAPPTGTGSDLSDALAARAVDLAGIGVWHRVLGQDHVTCNGHMFRILGLPPTPHGLSLARLQAMQHPEDRGRAQALNEAVVAGGGPLESQLRYVLGDGRVVHLLSRRSVLRDGQGRPTAMLGVTLDVSEQRRAEQELLEARERAALAVGGAGIGTWEWHSEGDTARWDDNMFHLRGLPPGGEAPGHAARMALVHPDDREVVDTLLRRAVAEHVPIAYEFRIVRPDGQVRWLASRSVELPDPVRGGRCRIGANWDVTDRRQAEQSRRDTEVALRESQAKSRFLARMSHELRTPLNAVLGFAQLLQKEPADGTPAAAARQESLAHIQRAGEHLLTLINEVLDLARIEAGEMDFERAPVPLATLVERTLPLVAPQAQAGDIRLRTGPLEGVALGDETRLRQVLLNLLSNAIKYNRAGGEVQVEAATRGAFVHLRVRDNGHGIAPARLGELFEPFNRLGAERSAIEGTGIGLAIVKSLVEHMGGHVQVQSSPGAGSVFEVVLPQAEASGPVVPAGPAQPLPTAAPATAVPAPKRERRVLYIEDNEVNALIVREILATVPGYALAVAPDGARGLAMAADEPPEIILLDMQLPDMDGFEVLRRLRQQPATASLPVVALSANVMPEQVSRGRAAGLADYWTKPLDMGHFVQGLMRLLPPHAP